MLGALRAGVVRLRQGMDMMLSRQIFGNPAGFSNNVAGELDLGLRRLRRRLRAGARAAGPASQLRREGLYLFPAPAPAERIEPIARKFASLIQDDRYSLRRASAAARHRDIFQSRILRDARCLLPELMGVLDPELQDVVAEYFGGHFDVLDVLAWRNYGPAEDTPEDVEIYSDYWHCDRISPTILKFFLLLEPVDESLGPLHMLRRTPSRRYVRDREFSRVRYRLSPGSVKPDVQVIKLTGPIGSRALCNTVQCLHRAGRPEPGKSRDILQIQFQPSDRPFDPSRLSAFQTASLDTKYQTRPARLP